ncbi:hypothetical protein DFH29DRAFT_962910, partial [Suillus ampliporus]
MGRHGSLPAGTHIYKNRTRLPYVNLLVLTCVCALSTSNITVPLPASLPLCGPSAVSLRPEPYKANPTQQYQSQGQVEVSSSQTQPACPLDTHDTSCSYSWYYHGSHTVTTTTLYMLLVARSLTAALLARTLAESENPPFVINCTVLPDQS